MSDVTRNQMRQGNDAGRLPYGPEALGLLALNAISPSASFATTSFLLAPPLNEQINHAANHDDCPGRNGQEPCLSAPHFAFPRIVSLDSHA
ncbi:MAG: hypothetical protein FJX45_17030 [Alphaproteobacteria bacterium]|nr:hypothetical protein [Alphaproteobacteria bacterium]